MAVVEQIVIGSDPTVGKHAKTILARSAGVARECAREIRRHCESWGDIPDLGLARAALLSFPLVSKLPALPGKLFAVVHIAPGIDPIFHAIIISDSDYGAAGRTPYALLNDTAFLTAYDPDIPVERFDLKLDSLSPQISPLPTDEEISLLEEGLHQLLANGTLIFPLEGNDELSDRYLSMLLLALPVARKKSLRFASYATCDHNKYGLAAVYLPGSRRDGWQRFLMTRVCGKIPDQNRAYISEVRNCLVVGNLQGLEKISLEMPVDLEYEPEKISPPKQDVVAATIQPRQSRTLTAVPAVSPGAPKRSKRRQASQSTASSRTAARTSRPARRGRRKTSRWFAGTLAVVVVVVGFVVTLSQSGRFEFLVPWLTPERAEPQYSLLGVVDVGALYDNELQQYAKQGALAGAGDAAAEHPALTALKTQAAGALTEQSELFIDLVNEGILQHGQPAREADRLESLEQRGQALEYGVKRLQLAYYSLAQGVCWRDLGRLSDQVMAARWDSLRQRRAGRLQEVEDRLGMTRVLKRVKTARRQVTGMSDLVTGFAAARRGPQWTAAMQDAAEAIIDKAPNTATLVYRTTALDLARLKRAEDAAGFAALAFADEYVDLNWLPGSVRDVLASIRRDTQRRGSDQMHPLLADNLAFYAALDNLAYLVRQGTQQQMSTAIESLESNRAVDFDGVSYAFHLDRIRMILLGALLDQGLDRDEVPREFIPAEDRYAAFNMLEMLSQPRAEQRWRDFAATTDKPFFERWAIQVADDIVARENRLAAEFDERYAALARATTTLRAKAAAGIDWSGDYVALRQQLAESGQRFQDEFANDQYRTARFAQLQGLAADLERPLSLALSSVTVRLDQAIMSDPTAVVLELRVDDGEPVLRSDAFPVGPAAPAGSGWVGTLALAGQVMLGSDASLSVVVAPAEGGAALLTIDYGALLATDGPGALSRPRAAASGSVAFKLGDGFWRQLRIDSLDPGAV